MAAYIDMESLRFQLFNVHEIGKLCGLPRFIDYDEAAFQLLLDAVKDFSDQSLFPVFRDMDEHPAHFADGKIITHPSINASIKKAAELGLCGDIFDFEAGGNQIPAVLHTAAYYILDAANNNFSGYVGLTLGAAELILNFGSEDLQQRFVPKMVKGEWAGTMCLTEPQAGSSLSDIVTTAYPQADGTYKIKGQKIFISGGDHEHCPNFIHLLLARIEGAPAGTKGISLFVVPKNRMASDGSLESNDVVTAGDFQKLGQRGYCTTHLVFGEHDDCVGHLVGAPHKGLSYMFQMMNGARIAVGRGAAAIACAAYHASLQYARERPQGRRIESDGNKDVDRPQSLIIEHADVRRMLLLQKAIYEGSTSLIMQAAYYQDMAEYGPEDTRHDYHLLLELLTPIVKTYPAEKGKEAVDNGLQVLGGYGFCSDFVLQQYFRDIRIYAIYEGTTGIQSIDLLGRKLTMENGKALQLLMKEISHTMAQAAAFEDLQAPAEQLKDALKEVKIVLDFLMPYAQSGNYERFLADATLFMSFFGTITVAWQWLKMGVAAKNALAAGHCTPAFCNGTLQTMHFFFAYELALNTSHVKVICHNHNLTLTRDGLFDQ